MTPEQIAIQDDVNRQLAPIRAQLAAAEQRAAQAERDAVRECEMIAKKFQAFAKKKQDPLDVGYEACGRHIAGEIRNRYPQHFKGDE